MADKAQKKKILTQVDTTLKQLDDAGRGMDSVSSKCQSRKGEALYDRVEQCEAALNKWKDDVTTLDATVAALLKMIHAAWPDEGDPEHGGAVSIATEVYRLSKIRADAMKSKMKTYRKQLEKHKKELRKVKAK